MDTEWTVLLQIRIPILKEQGWQGSGRSNAGRRQKVLVQHMGFASSKQDQKLHVACLLWFPPYESKSEAETHHGQLTVQMMLERGGKPVTCFVVMQRTCLSLVKIGVELSSSYKPSNFKKLLSWILNNQGKPELFAMMTWGIWYKWNQVHLHKPCCTSDLIATQAKERLQEFTAALPPKPPRMTRTRGIWKPPNASYFKINFDGGVFRNENKSSIGVVIWDHTSFVIA